MPENDREVFEHFQALGSGQRLEVGLMAYARFAQEKYNWMDHQQVRTGSAPTDEEIANWIASDLTNSRLDDIYNAAVNQFRAAAEDYLAERGRALEDRIVGRVDAAAQRVERSVKFWPRLIPDIMVGVAVTLTVGVLLVVAAILIRGDSFIALLREVLGPPPPAGH
jgi:hypothetical protein